MEIEKIRAEILQHLENDPEKLEKFNSLMAMFKENPSNPVYVFSEISNMINDNQILFHEFQNAIQSYNNDDDPIEMVGSFVRYVNQLCEGKLDFLKKFTRIVSLFVEDLIPISFFKIRLMKISQDLGEEKQMKIIEFAEKLNPDIQASRDLLFHRIRKNVSVLKTLEFVLNPMCEQIPQIQFVVMMSIELNEEEINSVLKCLELFGLQIINESTATEWIGSIHQFLGEFFSKTSRQYSPFNYHPGKINSVALKEIKKNLFKWAVDSKVFELLSQTDMPKYLTPLQIAVARKLNQSGASSQDEDKSAPYISELKSIKMFNFIKQSLVSVKNGDIYNIPDDIIRTIFGSYPSEHKQITVLKTAIENAFQIGSKAMGMNELLCLTKMNNLDPSSPDYRCLFKSQIKRPVVKRRLVFKGIGFNTPSKDSLSLALGICHEFIQFANIYDLTFPYEELINTRYLCEGSALSLVYFFLIVNMIEDAGEYYDLIANIPTLIKENEYLSAYFPGKKISQIDIVLSRFLRMLKLRKNEPNSYGSTTMLSSHSFIYNIWTENNRVYIKGLCCPSR